MDFRTNSLSSRLSMVNALSILAFAMSMLAAPPVQADCLRFLSGGFDANKGFTATAAVKLFEMSESELKARVPEGAVIVLSGLSEKGVDLAKLEKILSENWLVGLSRLAGADGRLIEDKIRAAISDGSLQALARFTADFFTLLEHVLVSRPVLAIELREVVLGDLRRRVSQEQVEQARAQEGDQKAKQINVRFAPTSTGAVFEPFDHPTMGKSVKDPNGRIWSEVLPGTFNNRGTVQNGIVTNSEAVKACEKIGGTLPTRKDYDELSANFDLESHQNRKMTPQGLSDLYRIFPDMKGVSSWSSSVCPDLSGLAYSYLGDGGYVVFAGRADSTAVRCISL